MENRNPDPEEVGGPEDPGEPITELRDLEVEVSSGFLSRVLSALRRRSLVSQLTTMAWSGFGEAVLEFMGMVFSLFESTRADKGGSD